MKNTVSRLVCYLAAAMVVTSFLAPAALADADKDPKKESRRLQAQLSAVQKEKGMLTTQIEELKKQLDDIGSKSAALEKKSGGQRKQLAEMTEQYQEADKNLQQMMQLYVDASSNLQQLQTEKEQEQKRLSGEIQVCEKKNAELYRVSTELMDKYESKGIISVLLQAEPFTQLERVKIQNLMQEYGDKVQASKIVSARVPASEPVTSVPAPVASNAPVNPAVANASPESAEPLNQAASGNTASIQEPGSTTGGDAPIEAVAIPVGNEPATDANRKGQDVSRP